jgi:hypothetical protein
MFTHMQVEIQRQGREDSISCCGMLEPSVAENCQQIIKIFFCLIALLNLVGAQHAILIAVFMSTFSNLSLNVKIICIYLLLGTLET